VCWPQFEVIGRTIRRKDRMCVLAPPRGSSPDATPAGTSGPGDDCAGAQQPQHVRMVAVPRARAETAALPDGLAIHLAKLGAALERIMEGRSPSSPSYSSSSPSPLSLSHLPNLSELGDLEQHVRCFARATTRTVVHPRMSPFVGASHEQPPPALLRGGRGQGSTAESPLSDCGALQPRQLTRPGRRGGGGG